MIVGWFVRTSECKISDISASFPSTLDIDSRPLTQSIYHLPTTNAFSFITLFLFFCCGPQPDIAAPFFSVMFITAALHGLNKISPVCDDATFVSGLWICNSFVPAEKMCEKDRCQRIFESYFSYLQRTCSAKSYLYTMRKWIWVRIGLCRAVLFQKRFHQPLLCCWRSENGDSSEDIMSINASVCVYAWLTGIIYSNILYF